jgi:hypothetical protein
MDIPYYEEDDYSYFFSVMSLTGSEKILFINKDFRPDDYKNYSITTIANLIN